MKLMKKKIFGLLLAIVVCMSGVIVYAAEALTADQFKSKMKELGYETSGFGDYAYAYPSGSSLYSADYYFTFKVYDSAEEAQEDLDEAYEMTEDYDSLSRSKVSSGNKGCITVSGKEDGEYGYLSACRIDNTVVTAMANDKENVSAVKDTMKDLGYSCSSSWIIFLVIGVVVVAAVVVVVVVVTSKKKKPNYYQNGMYPNQNMNYGQPNNNMNQGMNFGQPNNNMDQGMNFGQPNNNMNQGVNFGQPNNNMNQGMNFGQPNNNNNFPNNNNQF